MDLLDAVASEMLTTLDEDVLELPDLEMARNFFRHPKTTLNQLVDGPHAIIF